MAIGNDQNLNIIVRLKDEASKQLDNFTGKIEGMKPKFQAMAAVGTAAFVGITAVAYKSVNAFAEAERAQRQLEHAVIGISKGTAEQVKQVEEITQALEKKAGVDADALKIGVAQLSTFGLQSESVVKLTKSLADFTVSQNGLNASAGEYEASANIMAKALNGEFGRLQMLGIRFTEAQKQTILFGTESEKVAAIQEGLAQNLKETTDTVGGVDLAMAKANRAMENISENVGRALAPAFVSLMEKVQPVIEALADWAENNPTLVATLVAAGLAISAIVAGLGFLGLVLPMIIGGFTLLISPVGLIIAGIVALIAVLVYLGTHLEELKEGWTLVFSAIAIGFQGWWAKVSGIFNSFRESISTMWVSIKSTFLDGINFLVGLAEGWANTYVKAANTIIEALNSIQVSVPDWVPGVGGKSFGIDIPLVPEVSLPRFEMGGTVPGARGTATQIIAHGGERIIPAGGSDGGGVNISLVMNYPRFNSRDDVNVVREQLDAALRDVVRNYKLQPA